MSDALPTPEQIEAGARALSIERSSPARINTVPSIGDDRPDAYAVLAAVLPGAIADARRQALADAVAAVEAIDPQAEPYYAGADWNLAIDYALDVLRGLQ